VNTPLERDNAERVLAEAAKLHREPTTDVTRWSRTAEIQARATLRALEERDEWENRAGDALATLNTVELERDGLREERDRLADALGSCACNCQWVNEQRTYHCRRCEALVSLLLRVALAETYTPEGVETWLAAHKHVPLVEQLRKARSLTGMVAT
jgi:hypothetical protein